ncbi:NAD(P)/FAD-dependent oxidoreductase [Kordiimonas marina]|uniref:NAD(P)/FAD-dependent oxidoreductase n=1 Tax=Kordiimonas marina TaxID=2872312 RepID=UPI001FF1F284|nr:FAD-binding oxidoreductase [Kordiimonas marina]MCJ9427673.1 FAD-binding oxidoreductase [Kordiimonas marina]
MAGEFPESWYAASAGKPKDWPALAGDVTADVCVIGGGFTGLSTALSLAEQGRDVVLLEARQVGWGASGRNGGQMIHGFVGQDRVAKHAGADKAASVRALTWAGHDLIRARVDTYGIDCDLTPGWLEVALTPRQNAGLYHQYNEMETLYPDRGFHYMGPDELEERIGTKRYLGGFLSKSDGHLHPLKLCFGLAAAADGLGVKIHEHSAVTKIEPGETVAIHTAGGTVRAKELVLAANAHNDLFKRRMSGFAFPAGSFMIATEPLSGEQLARLNPNRWAICDSNMVCDYYRMGADGRILFGGRVNFSGRKPRSIKAKLLPRLLKTWPELEGIKVTHEWGGKLGVSIGEVPLVGQIGDNIWYSFGYTGHGVNMGNLMGKVVAEAMMGDRARFDLLADVPKWRLPFGRTIGRQIVASAILYYKLRDRL